MVPIYPRDIVDGTYEIEAESSSSFFKITKAELLVDGDEMSARITISNLSYEYVYPGTVKEAEKAVKDNWIGYEESDGKGIFTIPVEALDKEIDCAAFSKKKQKWYDRKLVFDTSCLPKEALLIELPDYELIEKAILDYQTGESDEDTGEQETDNQNQNPPEAVDISRPDGEYSIEVNMTGGSSTFEIPITAMDEAMPIIADTTAMGDPVEIEYTLNFYSETIGNKDLIPQESAKKVLVIALAIIILGGILNHFVKKKRK